MSSAYSFLPSMRKQKLAHSKIFARINVNGSVSYGAFLDWVHNTLAAKDQQKKL
jgi:hypothetical protein